MRKAVGPFQDEEATSLRPGDSPKVGLQHMRKPGLESGLCLNSRALPDPSYLDASPCQSLLVSEMAAAGLCSPLHACTHSAYSCAP